MPATFSLPPGVLPTLFVPARMTITFGLTPSSSPCSSRHSMRPGSVTRECARALRGELSFTFLDRETCQALRVHRRASFVVGKRQRLDDAQERYGHAVAPRELYSESHRAVGVVRAVRRHRDCPA